MTAIKVEKWEDYAVIGFCENMQGSCEHVEQDCKTGVNMSRASEITANENVSTLKSQSKDPVKCKIVVQNVNPVMESIDGNDEIVEQETSEKFERFMDINRNTFELIAIDSLDAEKAVEFCHVAGLEAGERRKNDRQNLKEDVSKGARINEGANRDMSKNVSGEIGVNEDTKVKLEKPPKMPGESSAFCERVGYIETGISWIRNELMGLREVDQKLMATFRELISQSRKLRRVNDTFMEQQEILEEIDDIFEKEEFENSHLIDKPSHCEARLGIQRKVSNLDRYIRIGRVGRRASHY